MKKRWAIITALAAAFMLATMFACGGGGGGSSESVNYDGNTHAAVIDTNSAVQLALNSTVGTKDTEDYGGGVSPLSIQDTDGGLDLVQKPGKAIDMIRTLMEAGRPVEPLGEATEPLGVECRSMHMDTGSVGGTMSLEICADPEKYYSSTRYWISAGVIFDEYDNGTDYQDGELVVDGVFDETIGDEGDFDGEVTVTFRDLVTIDTGTGEDSYIDGWAVYMEGVGTVTITYNLAVIDSATGDAYWMDNYVIHIDHVNDEVTLSGRFYDSVAGYVDLTTETVLEWDVDMDSQGELVWNSDHPTAGTVMLTGADGYWISISFTVSGFTVQVNFTGDDAADATIGPISWIT